MTAVVAGRSRLCKHKRRAAAVSAHAYHHRLMLSVHMLPARSVVRYSVLAARIGPYLLLIAHWARCLLPASCCLAVQQLLQGLQGPTKKQNSAQIVVIPANISDYIMPGQTHLQVGCCDHLDAFISASAALPRSNNTPHMLCTGIQASCRGWMGVCSRGQRYVSTKCRQEKASLAGQCTLAPDCDDDAVQPGRNLLAVV